MQLGMIGLGRRGASMVSRLMRGGHECVVFDTKPESVDYLANNGATGAATPLRNPAEVWRRGSVVSSWLPDLTAIALFEQPDFGDKLLSAMRFEFGGHMEKEQ